MVEANRKYEVVIGLEVHAQLLTRSKMFCSCPSDYIQSAPNTVVCPVCLGMPGTLPVINSRAVEYVIMTGLALNSEISENTQFHRKNYPYPDLMKGYQISQYDEPIANGGWLNIEVDGVQRQVQITRVHLEEDVAKLQHHQPTDGEDYSLVDVNRSGSPLMETVSEPDMHSAEEARQYLLNLRAILQYLGVSTGNMEDGSFRCDANISIRPAGSTELFSKVEVKNMNSLRAVYRALQHEEERQIKWLRRAAEWCRRPGDGWKTGASPSPSGPRSLPTTTVTSRSLTCPLSPSAESGWRRSGRDCRSCRQRVGTGSSPCTGCL